MDPFKAYDIRGMYPEEVDEVFAYELGKAVATFLKAKVLVVGRDARASSDELYKSLVCGIAETGTNVISIGKVSTPLFYFALYSSAVDGGVMITASHNPAEYNGFKICSANAKPVFIENGLQDIKKIMQEQTYNESKKIGHIIKKDYFRKYIEHFSNLAIPLQEKHKILIDTGNGMGILEARALKAIYEDKLTVKTLFPTINGTFPNHECNPIKIENMTALVSELKKGRYELGAGFDGDADRAVFFTKQGEMVPPDLVTALLAPFVAKKHDKIGYEVRSSQAVKKELEKYELRPLLFPSGHAYIKQHMVKEGAVFCGEKSGHYFYHNLHNTDSSLYTVMHMLEILDSTKKTMEELVTPLQEAYASIPEQNYTVHNPDTALQQLKETFSKEAKELLEIDGVSIYADHYFFNARKSNTEPLVRVNIEADDQETLKKVKERIEKVIGRY